MKGRKESKQGRKEGRRNTKERFSLLLDFIAFRGLCHRLAKRSAKAKRKNDGSALYLPA